MADNFFDGTWSDFYDDPALLSFAALGLPLESPSPPQRIHMPPADSSSRLEPQAAHNARFRPSPRDRSAPFGSGVVREASALPSEDLGSWSVPGPTRPASNRRPTPAASRRPELSRNNASRRRVEDQTPSPRAPACPTFPPPSNLNPIALSSAVTAHGHPNSQRSLVDNFPTARLPRNVPPVSSRRRSPRQDYIASFATATAADFPRQPATPPLFKDPVLRPPIMSSNTRRRSVRPGDLTMPTPPSLAAQMSMPAPRTTRRSTSQSVQPEQGASSSKRKRESDLVNDLFGDGPFDDQQVVDLVDKDEVPSEILNSQEKKNYTRMSTFDCVICMDSVKDLTVTHCGHLFCSACLHSALNMDPNRRICPICRQKIDKMPINGSKFGQKAKGYYSLELKLLTRKSLGAKAE
ncbi:hypothetical protein CHGG_03255 [Chaetomium globosum CBS 148.51]|uniref:RING-type domain-containing protein n=1 Tax=Chaetomium globosum (strain ATCC 6205 / CBS 148.51 / DSM 1962 / NBRC 6347 / NRRL 1970) TaxID=306901 RepID=Q2H949_CHAGB|nr:uncharacterized protein CHGG_03255 [Chaetomium globosum CBS 148.51]EAQ91320.1 hypothetical protein CHGG_03255 [Chaetomium globosum CBS 148.51]